MTHIFDFIDGNGFFSELDESVKYELQRATVEVCIFDGFHSYHTDKFFDSQKHRPDPLAVFQSFGHPGHPPTPFTTFARRLLSVSANSASCERLFSVFGNTLTKLQNCLGRIILTQLSVMKMHVRDEQLESGGKGQLKRRFEARAKGKERPVDAQMPGPLFSGM